MLAVATFVLVAPVLGSVDPCGIFQRRTKEHKPLTIGLPTCDATASFPICSTLVFNKAASGDAYGTLERISRCVEVYEQYPGLCRCMMRW